MVSSSPLTTSTGWWMCARPALELVRSQLAGAVSWAPILAAASQALKEKGFQGIGVDGLAASAQVTSGALYSNFGSKEAFLEQVVDAQLGAEFAVVDDPDPAERRRRLVEFLGVYLGEDHRGDVAHGCVRPSLSADVSRAGDSVREVYQRRVLDLVAPATRRVLDQTHRDGIILLHDLYKGTVPAVPGIIKSLEQRGYTIVTVSELLAPAKARAGMVYRP